MGIKYAESARPIAINPLKFSQPMGAALAFLGIDRAVPLLHGCQGCTAFIKSTFVKHFREPAFVHTTALTEIEAIMNSTGEISKSLKKLFGSLNPEIIGIITTGLTEVKGDDIGSVFRQSAGNVKIIPVSTPDYAGCMQQGFAEAAYSIVRNIAICSDHNAGKTDKPQINLLAASFLTPADIWVLKEAVSSFGLKAVVIPDISGSLDGHMDEEQSFISRGGTTLTEISGMSGSIASISIGESMRRPASLFREKMPVYYLDTIYGLDAFDDFLMLLSDISGREIPEKFRRERKQLLDAMLDTHFYISGKRFCLGLEPDLLYNVAQIILEMGGIILKSVIPIDSAVMQRQGLGTIMVGDLYDFEDVDSADMLMANSNGVYAAEKIGAPLFKIGFPVVDRLGINQRELAGYKGMMNLLFEIGNIFMENLPNRRKL